MLGNEEMREKNNKIRVLQVNKLYYPVTGGIERVVQQLAEGLCEDTDTKVLVCRRKGRTIVEQIAGIEVTRASSMGMLSSLPLSVSFLWKFRRMAKDRDIIHIHMPFPLGDLACFLSGYKGRVILWWHSDIVRQKKLMKLYRPLMEWLLRRADCIVVATQGHIDGSKYLKPYQEKCRIIPFGVDLKIEKEADRWYEEGRLLERSEEKPDAVKFLFVGRLVYYKGCRTMIEAFVQAAKGNSRIQLDIVGTGSLEPELKKQTEEMGLTDRIYFHADVSDDELIQYFKECDVFVLPSLQRSEAFGLVQIEAMAFGKPVINTKLPSGVPYVSLHGETGLTVEPGNAAELAEAMQYLAEHPVERCRIGERARARMEEQFRMDKMLKRVLQLYEEFVERGEDS
jgi:rhamnosyl/mannosyltransferase